MSEEETSNNNNNNSKEEDDDETSNKSSTVLRDELDALNAKVTKQGSYVRELKKKSNSTTKNADEINNAVKVLQQLKQDAVEMNKKLEDVIAKEGNNDIAQGGGGGNNITTSTTTTTSCCPFDRKLFDDLILRKMYIVPSFEIHGGVKGLYDLGPSSCSMKTNMIDLWRKHFILHDNMLEMECTNLTPQVVLKTSGHVDRFTDLMVKDPITMECYRADKLLEDAIDNYIETNPTMSLEEKEEHYRIQRQADSYESQEIDRLLTKYNCKCPSGASSYTSSFPFNLMFQTHIGPENTSIGYLRPETAQGLFVNYKRLLELNNGHMPFAAAQIGIGFRNEISPRSGLLRVREFCMAEIEHFTHPIMKQHHSNFHQVSHIELVLFHRDDQLGTGKTKTITAGDAVTKGIINNETLAYYMVRTQLYMIKIGMDEKRLRFRQHLETEMAHYATDCWDLEIQSSYGWIECVGHADRACYDLQVHSAVTKTSMMAVQRIDPPQTKMIAKIKLNRKLLGQVFKQEQRIVANRIEQLAEDWTTFEPIVNAIENNDMGNKIIIDGKYEITKDMILSYTKTTKMIHEMKYTPSVIEPSFGMGRILYSLLEHSFYYREYDSQRCVMRFNSQIAPYKCAIIPISSGNNGCDTIVSEIALLLQERDLSIRIDSSSTTVGRKYSRMDELGIPFCITVDFRTLMDHTVTIRERDTTQQIRIHRKEVSNIIYEFVYFPKRISWEILITRYPIVTVVNDDVENENDDRKENNKNMSAEKGKAAAVVVAAAADTTTTTFVETTSRGRFRRPTVPVGDE